MNRHHCECSICTERGEEIERLQEAKRRALQIADERAKEAAGLRAQLAVAMDALNKISTIAGNMQGHIADAALANVKRAF